MGRIQYLGEICLEEHEGYVASILDDVRLSENEYLVRESHGFRDTATWCAEIDQHIVAFRAACACGWRGERIVNRQGDEPEPVEVVRDGLLRAWDTHVNDVASDMVYTGLNLCSALSSYSGYDYRFEVDGRQHVVVGARTEPDEGGYDRKVFMLAPAELLRDVLAPR